MPKKKQDSLDSQESGWGVGAGEQAAAAVETEMAETETVAVEAVAPQTEAATPAPVDPRMVRFSEVDEDEIKREVAAKMEQRRQEQERIWREAEQKRIAQEQEMARMRARELTLEESALNLLNQLDVRYKEQILRIAKNIGCSAWQVILGGLIRQGDQGTLSEIQIDPTWQARTFHANKLDVAQCKGCDTHFETTRFGQVYCCSPCGERALGHFGPNAHAKDCSTQSISAHGAVIQSRAQPAAA